MVGKMYAFIFILVWAVTANVDAAPSEATQPIYFCLAPPDPIFDEHYLEIYGRTIETEFAQFYDEANAYLICLQRTQQDWAAHVRELTKAHQDSQQ